MPRAYMRVIYTRIYVIHVYALERFILNIFCVNRRIYSIRLFYNVPIWLFWIVVWPTAIRDCDWSRYGHVHFGITAWVLKHTTRKPRPPERQFDITVQKL